MCPGQFLLAPFSILADFVGLEGAAQTGIRPAEVSIESESLTCLFLQKNSAKTGWRADLMGASDGAVHVAAHDFQGDYLITIELGGKNLNSPLIWALVNPCRL